LLFLGLEAPRYKKIFSILKHLYLKWQTVQFNKNNICAGLKTTKTEDQKIKMLFSSSSWEKKLHLLLYFLFILSSIFLLLVKTSSAKDQITGPFLKG
jgi:hypothetical protein